LGHVPLPQLGPDPTDVDFIATSTHPGVAGEPARHAAGPAGQRLTELIANIGLGHHPGRRRRGFAGGRLSTSIAVSLDTVTYRANP